MECKIVTSKTPTVMTNRIVYSKLKTNWVRRLQAYQEEVFEKEQNAQAWELIDIRFLQKFLRGEGHSDLAAKLSCAYNGQDNLRLLLELHTMHLRGTKLTGAGTKHIQMYTHMSNLDAKFRYMLANAQRCTSYMKRFDYCFEADETIDEINENFTKYMNLMKGILF